MSIMNQKSKTILLIILGVIVSFGLISYQFKENPEEASELALKEQEEESVAKEASNSFELKRSDLDLIEAKNTNRAIKWPISGRVVPKNTTQVYSEVQGKVLNSGFRLKEGLSFQAGDELVTLDAREFELQLEAQRSAFLNILTGMMPDLKADYPDNYNNWLRYVERYEAGEDLMSLPQTASDGEKYYVTSNQVFSTYYTIKAQEERLSKFRIIAPYNGLVTKALADKGTLVSPGQQLATIINNESFELEAATNLEVATELKIGDQVVFTSNEIEGVWMGTVLRINDIIDAKTQNIPVFFAITGANLKAGMYLEGSFEGEVYHDVVAIPSSVLTRDTKVLLLEDNVIKGKPVELVEFMLDSILVRGLNNEDVVIANQFNVPVEGLKLTL